MSDTPAGTITLRSFPQIPGDIATRSRELHDRSRNSMAIVSV